ncbi:MAG: 50S ribosomal protein L1 [Planctomycetes bacterium]|nr:50S ribosomal protein L1 [Planctomycetota bacterium]
MRERSKRYKKLVPLVDAKKRYNVEEAIAVLKKMEGTKFDQTINCAMKLGVDPKKADQNLRGSVALPKGIGKSRKVIVFAQGEDARHAQEAGADEVGADDLVKKVGDGWTDFDIAIAAPNMMRSVGKLGKVLGPQGKMPSPKSGTVTEDISTAVREFKAGKIEYRCDAGGNIHAPVGKISFTAVDLKTNVEAFIEHIRASRPPSAKGHFIQNIALSPTMGPGVSLVLE